MSTLRKQRGIALVFVLMMMALVFSIAAISTRISTQGERMARADRDRQVAMQGAEAALLDAEMDIMDPKAGARACIMLDTVFDPGCSADSFNRGICGLDATQPDKPLYKMIDWEEEDSAKRKYVYYGEFTNRAASIAVASSLNNDQSTIGVPADSPKYIIEKVIMAAPMRAKTADGDMIPINRRRDAGTYRVYAIGYGYSKSTKVMLEAVIFSPVVANRCTGS